MIGETIAQYQITAKLGATQTGAVFSPDGGWAASSR